MRRFLVLAAIAVLAFLVARGGRGCGGPVEVGTPAPAFQARDARGEATWSLPSFQGRPFALVFFATWCPSCREELPMVDRVAAGRSSVLLVSDEAPGHLGPWLAARKVRVPAAAGAGGTLRDYNIHVLPSAVVVDATGTVAYAGEGPSSVSRALRRLGELEAGGDGAVHE